MDSTIYKRKCVEDIEKYLEIKEAIVLYGARQVGKTSIIKYLLENKLKDNAFYLDLELKKNRDLCNSGAEQLYNYLLQIGANNNKKIFLAVDEIQLLEDPSSFIKIICDHYPQIKLLVSGSSTFEIKKKFKDSLVGRTVNFEIYPLTFDEFLEFKNKTYILTDSNNEEINKELFFLAEEFIKYGGYPRIVLENSEEIKFKLLSQIIETYIQKDIKDIGKIQNVDGFNKLLEILASQTGNILNISELSNTLGMARKTIVEYLMLLENTFIIKLISPYHNNLRTELTKNPKIYMLDTGIAHILWLKEFPHVLQGNIIETYVFNELAKTKSEIHYWRTLDKQEIDFIVKIKNSLIAIKVKKNFQSANNKALLNFNKLYGAEIVTTSLIGKKESPNLYPWELVKKLQNSFAKL